MLDLDVFAGNSFFYPIMDNTYLCFKALEKRDREKFIEGFNKLSKASVYHRFFGFMKELSDKQLTDLLSTDKKDHVAWAAFDIKDDDMIGVGVGRFKRSATSPHEAELALTVIDAYQNKGVGSILLAIMYFLASKLEIDIFTGFILSDNSKLIQRFRDLGAIMTRTGNEFEMRLPVFKDFNKISNSNYSSVIKLILKFLEKNNFCA